MAQKLSLAQLIKSYFYLFLGVAMATLGLKGFLLPNHFLDGGAMGVSLLLQIVTPLDLSLLIVLVNLPFIFMASRQLSWRFALNSALAIALLAFSVHHFEFAAFTEEKLLIAVFGGFFLGAGIGLTIRGGAVIDGTEVLAIAISRKSSLSVGDFIALFNVVLFICAAFLLNIEVAMYSMLTYFAASKTVDFILNGIEEYLGVMIVSEKHEAIRKHLVEELGRGVTAFLSDQGYTGEGPQRKVLFCAITRLEVARLIDEVEEIDPKAFVIQYALRDTKGGMIKRRPLH